MKRNISTPVGFAAILILLYSLLLYSDLLINTQSAMWRGFPSSWALLVFGFIVCGLLFAQRWAWWLALATVLFGIVMALQGFHFYYSNFVFWYRSIDKICVALGLLSVSLVLLIQRSSREYFGVSRAN